MDVTFSVSVPVERTPRVLQLEGLFDVPPARRSERAWTVSLPLDAEPWQVGLVVGPSGSGKSTLAREAWPDALVGGYDWPADRAVVDGFPAGLGIKDITGALSSVGFSSPPSWLRPFRCLSNGEQFRATLARAFLDPRPVVCVDEFTSVVDRTVAQVGSAAVAKAVRRTPGKRFVAVTCHADVEEWLCPDWVVEMPQGAFTRRSVRRRPPVELQVKRVHPAAWELFQHHHYLDTSLHVAARCFVAFWRGRPVAFASSIHMPGRGCWWREHRTVCLPDYQGVGIGNALSEYVGGVMKAVKGKYFSSTGNPAMVRHRARSPLWRMDKAPQRRNSDCRHRYGGQSRSRNRLIASFEYVGPARREDARRFGLL